MPRTPRPSDALETIGPVPEANQPGHHPEVEQDKPSGPPPGPRIAPPRERFAFRFDPRFLAVSAPFGILPATTYIDVDEEVRIRFGPWWMQFPCADVVSIERTGPYQPWKVLGPPHLSLGDKGITFATNASEGVCLRLAEAHPAIDPLGIMKHPGVTLTPESPTALVEAIER